MSRIVALRASSDRPDKGIRRTEGTHSLPQLSEQRRRAHELGRNTATARFGKSLGPSRLTGNAPWLPKGLPAVEEHVSKSALALPMLGFTVRKQKHDDNLALSHLGFWKSSDAFRKPADGNLPFLQTAHVSPSPRLLSPSRAPLASALAADGRSASQTSGYASRSSRWHQAESNERVLPTALATHTSGSGGWGVPKAGFASLEAAASVQHEQEEKQKRALGGGMGRRPLSMAERKNSQQAALNADRQYVQHLLVECAEPPPAKQARDDAVDKLWLHAIFSPVPSPLQYLPLVFHKRVPAVGAQAATEGLKAPVSPTVASPLSPSDSSGTPAFGLQPQAALPGEAPAVPVPVPEAEPPPTLQPEEIDQVLRTCILFHLLVTPPSRGGRSGPMVMCRSTFCRLMIVLEGMSPFTGGHPQFIRAIERFDEQAEPITVKSTWEVVPGNVVVGFLLFNDGSMGLVDLPICKFFAQLLEEMSGDVARSNQMSMYDNRQREFCRNSARTWFFGRLLLQAQEYAKERTEHVRFQISAATSTATAAPEFNASLARDSTAVVKAAESEGQEDSSAASSADASDAGDAEGSQFLEADVHAEDKDGSLFAHTFGVLKGETLMGQLTEPEVIQFMAECSGLFRCIFEAYVDVPVPDNEGHMTLSALLRFCGDFGLFPHRVDYQTIHWIYTNAESAAHTNPSRKTPSQTGAQVLPEDEVGDEELSTKQSKKEKDQSKLSTKSRARKPVAKVQPDNSGFLFLGKWMQKHLTWMTKDAGSMSSTETRSVRILHAIAEWMEAQSLTVEDLFNFMDKDNSGALSIEELLAAVDFMGFENAPTSEDIQHLARLVMPPPVAVIASSPPTASSSPTGALSTAQLQFQEKEKEQEIDFTTMQMALMAAVKFREKESRVTNFFMKDQFKMSKAQANISIFLRELIKSIERRKTTPEAIFKLFDTDKSGTLSCVELTRQSHAIFMMQKSLSPAMSIDRPFELL
ncbi:unnamed protein product, partial [Polarella glacialis]